MTKRELANRLSAMLGVPASPDCLNFIDAFAVVVTECLTREEPVQVFGFGTWRIRKRQRGKATMVHRITSREMVPRNGIIEKIIQFRPSPTMKAVVKGRMTPKERKHREFLS